MASVRGSKDYQGMNWIRQEKRLAIYIRDGLACVYCNANIEDTKLTLDHLTPYSQGGSNDASNLVTACLRCNSSRGVRSVEDFAAAVAGYLNGGTTPESITDFIALTVTRPLNVNAAREIIMNRREEVTE
jgi:hypothetical protein